MHTCANRKTVAIKTGLSESTVSRALSDSPLISAKTKETIRAAALKLGYVPNRQASLLSKRRTCRLGLIVPQYKNIPTFSRSYFPMILDGAIESAEARGNFVTIILDRKDDVERELVSIIRSREVDGLLLSILKKGDPRVIKLKESKEPFVLINSEEEGVTCVNHDPRPGMEKAFSHLAELGHRHIGFISGDLKYLNAVERMEVARKLADSYKIKLSMVEGNFSRTSGYYATGKFLGSKQKPTAIFTSSDREALGVLEYCRDHNISIPGELSLIGFDDFDSVSLVKPILSAVSNPVREASMVAVNLLLDIVEGKLKRPKTIRLKTNFTIRESTGPVNKQ